MFNTLETTWDGSARRGWSTLASFIFQGLALSLLFAIPLFWMEGPPRFRIAEMLPAPPAAEQSVPEEGRHIERSSNLIQGHVIQPSRIADTTPILNERPIPAAPDLGSGVPGAVPTTGRGVTNSIVDFLKVAAPPPAPTPVTTHPIRISQMAAGSLIHRVQPEYPEIARQARIQGAVQLRAIISRAGTIQNLTVESGAPMLIPSALKAVRQWRYRPYLLNGEPVEVDTQITVNFTLGG